jgi:hypothetical protein
MMLLDVTLNFTWSDAFAFVEGWDTQLIRMSSSDV